MDIMAIYRYVLWEVTGGLFGCCASSSVARYARSCQTAWAVLIHLPKLKMPQRSLRTQGIFMR